MNLVFRNLRKFAMKNSKVRQYIFYAIGETLLVVFGILIALQVNNWNERRKATLVEEGLLANLLQDLKSDSISFHRNSKTLSDIKSLHQACYDVGVNGADYSVINKPTYIRRLLYYNPIARANDPFITSKINNEKIRQEILAYFRCMNDMEDVYGELEDVVINRIRPFLADQEAQDITVWFENKDINSYHLIPVESLAELSKRPDFQQLLFEASVKLSENITALDLLVQQNNKLKSNIEDFLK